MNVQKTIVDQNTTIQSITLIVVSAFLILTAWGDASAMFWASTIAMIFLFVWLLADRKIWLAAVTAVVFSVTVVMTSSSLF